MRQDELSKILDIPPNTYRNYENYFLRPSAEILIRICGIFEISSDFLLLWDKTSYSRNFRFLSFARKADKLDAKARKKIEESIETLLGNPANKIDDAYKLDDIKVSLTENVGNNLTLLIEDKKVMSKDIASYLDVSASQISQYEKGKSLPSYENMVKLSDYFKVSIHALITGEKLIFDFQDKIFGKTILLADHFLPFEDHQILIRLMEAVLKK
jgi:transcriptional regulator with XRE-family HTH domain